MPDLSGFFSFVLIIFILFLAYVATRWYATKVKSMTNGKHIKVVDRVILGKDKGLMIVQVGKRVYMMSENGSRLTILNELEEKEINITDTKEEPTSFKDIIQTYLGLSISDDTAQKSMDNLMELKSKVSNSLNRMIKRHKGEEHANDENEENF